MNNSALVAGFMAYCEKDKERCGKTNVIGQPKSHCWVHNDKYYPNLEDFFKSFPTLEFDFGSSGEAVYQWKPEDYFYKDKGMNKLYCWGISKY